MNSSSTIKRFRESCKKAWGAVFRAHQVTAPWRNLQLSGEMGNTRAFLFFSGLSANGALAQKYFARELYRRFDRRCDFWQRNLWGHTGRYGDFRQSRMWNWLIDALRAARKLATRNNREIYLIGHSTGALVAVLVAWMFQKMPRLLRRKNPHAQIAGVVLNAPAFKLANRRNTRLLLMVLVLYYIIAPIVMIIEAINSPRLWDALLIAWLCLFVLLPRIRVPTGHAVSSCNAAERENVKRKIAKDEITALLMVLYFGLMPIFFLALEYFASIATVRFFIWFFIATIAYAFFKLPKGEVLDADWEDELSEQPECDCYQWLPVVTAATLVPLQWLSGYLVKKLECPVLVVLAGSDRVVDNAEARRLYEMISARDKTLAVLEGLPHANLSHKQQATLVDLCEGWVQTRSMTCAEKAVCSPAQEAMAGEQAAAAVERVLNL